MQARLVDWVEADPIHGAVLATLAGAVVAAHHAARELGLVRCRGKVRGTVRVSVRQGYKG